MKNDNKIDEIYKRLQLSPTWQWLPNAAAKLPFDPDNEKDFKAALHTAFMDGLNALDQDEIVFKTGSAETAFIGFMVLAFTVLVDKTDITSLEETQSH